jgi:hypothetical protein
MIGSLVEFERIIYPSPKGISGIKTLRGIVIDEEIEYHDDDEVVWLEVMISGEEETIMVQEGDALVISES